MKESKILEKIDKKSSVELLRKLIRIITTNPPAEEIRLARYVADFLRKCGLKTELLPFGDKRANVAARIKGTGEMPSLIYSAHFDTVPVGKIPWEFDPFSGVVHENRIYGRGAADMKGGMAAMMKAAQILAQSKVSLKGDLILAFTSGETSDLVGAWKLIRAKKLVDAGAVLVGEPTELNVYTAEKGALWLKTTTYGKTAHGSMQEYGENAILNMIEFLSKIKDFNFGVKPHPLLGRPTLSIGKISGGVLINIVPDLCEALLDVRYLPEQDPKELFSSLKEIGKPKVKMEIIGDPKPPVETDPNSPFAKTALEVVDKITGQKHQIGGAPYFTDAAVLANELKIPAVIIGPAKTWMTHQPNEYVEISNFLNAIKIYILFAMRYLGS